MVEPVFVWWIGEGELDVDAIDHATLHLARAFDAPVRLWGSAERPRDAFDPVRRQYASGKILRWILETGPGAGKVLGVTDQDLFIPILTYVFGEAQLGGGAAVVSTARLGEDVAVAGPGLLRDRLAKEAIHEVGHAFGLVHCGTPGCVMGRSAGVRDVDLKSHLPCADCRARLDELPAGGL